MACFYDFSFYLYASQTKYAITYMTRFIRNLILYAVISGCVFMLAGCREEKVWRIGVSQCSRDDWRSKMNDEINREIMFHKDAVVEIRSADDDNEKQIADIRYFADNGFDIIIAAPNEAEALTPVIKEVYGMGIPVLIFDREIVGDTYTARIVADDEGIGRAAAHYGRHMLTGPVNIIEIQGRKRSTPTERRHAGFVEGMKAEQGMSILASVHGNWNQEEAVPLVDSLLGVYPETNMVYAHNDRMAIGASEAALARGRGDIKIIGIDAAPNVGIRAVADSVIDATFLYPTEGHRLVRTALSILKGEPFERDEVLPLLSAVDLTNADILLLQNESLKEETDKMKLLKSQVDEYWERHSAQTVLFYASIVILALLFGVVFLLLRAFWQHKRHQEALMAQNRMLEEQRDMQEELNRQLAEATQSKLAFYTNVSHDLRTPLTLIAEPVEQLADATNLTRRQHSLLEIASRNVRILRRLINEILDFRKYENGKMQLNLREVDFGKLVEEWIPSFSELARRRRIKLRLDLCPEGEAILAIDVEKVERVFFNLMGNAFKYTPDNGEITFTCRADTSNLEFSVADTGKGIDAGDLEHIFESFFQVEKINPKGSGIGLSLAKAFVGLHGGTITVDSTPGKGSVFTVVIPIRHVMDDAADVPATESSVDVLAELEPVVPVVPDASGDKPVLLVIDDNPDIRALLVELLQEEYNVITACDGAQGVKMASKYVPDLVVCDVMMPGMDGLECCRILKSEVGTSHIPVLMLTACSLDEQRASGYDSGADGYLSKPFSHQVLRSRCRSLIENRKRIHTLYEKGAKCQPAATSASCVPSKIPTVKAPGDIDSEFYSRFVEIVNADMGNPELSVDELAARMGLGRSQFYRKIKALTNFSPVELLRDMRLNRARTLLAGTEKTISEIAYETGFSTPAYFTKCFRDAFGETPSDVRGRLGR